MALNQLGLGFQIIAQDLSEAVFKRTQGNVADVSEAAKKAAERLKETGEAMEKVGGVMAAVGLGGLVFLGIATAKAYEFEESLKAVAAQTNEAAFPMERMDELAGELAIKFGTLPAAQTAAMFTAVQQGARSGAEATALLTASNALAKASHIELGQAISTTSGLIKAYGLAFEQSAHVTDMLREASLQGNTTVTELGGAIEHFAPSAKRAGLSVEELLGSIGAMSKAGIQGRPALSGLKGIIDGIIEPSKDAAMEARRLGVEFSAAAVKSKGLPEVLKEISTSSAYNKDTLKKLFGSIESGTVAMALMKDNAKGLSQAIEDIGGSFGRTAEEAEALVTPEQRFAALKERAMELIGKALLPLVDGVTRVANVFLEGFTKIPKPVLAVGVVLAALGFGLLFVVGSAFAAAGAFLAMEGSLIPLLLTTQTILITFAAFAAALFAIAIPVGIVIYGIKVALDRNLGGIRDAFDNLYSKVKLIWDALTQVFRDGGFSGQVLKDLDKGNGGIQAFVIGVYVWAKRIGAFFDGISDGFDAAMKDMAPVFAMLKQAFGELADAVGKMFGGDNDPKTNADKFAQFKTAGEAVGAAIAAVVKVGVYWLTGLIKFWTVIANAIKWVIDVLGVFRDVAVAVFQVIEKPLERIASLIGKLTGLSVVKDVASWLGIGGHDEAKSTNHVGNRGGVTARPRANDSVSYLTPRSASVVQAQAAAARLQAGDGSEHDRQLVATMAAVLAQLKANGGQPVIVHVDGEKVAEVVGKRQAEHASRSFSPAPLPG